MKICCCICSRRTDSNKQRARIGTQSVWSMMEIHAAKVGLDMTQFSRDEFICMKCHATISHQRMTDRGPNKKMKICEPIVFEPVIKKNALRGYRTSEMSNTLRSSNNNELSMSMSMITNDEPNSGISTESNNALMEADIDSDIAVSSISESENMDYLVDETVMTTNVEMSPSATAESQNSESMSQETPMALSEQHNSSLTAKAVLRIQGTVNTQSCCIICGSLTGRRAIPWPAIQQVWMKRKCYIYKTNRTCLEHLTEYNKFSDEALQMIKATKEDIEVTSADFSLWLYEVTDMPKSTPYNLDNDGIPAKSYKMFFGISKENFDDLVGYLQGMRNTSTRSVRTALAMFLLLLRNNMKQEVIAFNFSTTQEVVSKTIDAVSMALSEHFVPHHLGYHHITREQALQQHSIKLTSKVLNQPESRLCVIADCTYNYIEKPSDFALQRKTFSPHKKRNLLKPLYLVFPTGYILEAAGPFFCDAKNNDAANIRYHYKHSDLLLFLEDEDYFVFGRGFRDVVNETASNGQNVFMPSLLSGKRTHFTSEEANSSRRVTMLRWVIEAANGRVKNVFPFFKHTIEGSYVPKIMRFNRIACAIINKYFPPLFSNQEFHDIIAEASINQTTSENKLKEEIESLQIQRMSARWIKASASTISDFPTLTMEDVKRMTLGTYQIKIAARYVHQHMKEDSEFGIFIHRENEGIIRAKIQSRFSKSKTHNAWVKFDSTQNGYEAIKGLYCTCKVGERSLGCCSHLTSVVRYLGYDRHQPIKPKCPRAAWDAIDCDGRGIDCDEDSDNDTSDGEREGF